MSIVNTKGVDISSHNGDINLSKVKKAGYQWVMIRCGYGDNVKSQDDSQFEANVKKAEKLGMPWGAYFYSYSGSPEQDKSELNHILRLLKGKKPTLPIAIDVEDADNYKKDNGIWNFSNVNRNTKYLLEGIKTAGYYPMLYTGFEEIENYISKDVWSHYDMWFAHWATKCGYTGKNLSIWQYGGEDNYIDGNTIPGVDGKVDKDIVYKDYPTIIKNGGYNNWDKPKPAAPPELVYRIKSGGKWSSEIKGPAKFTGSAITDIAIKASRGSVMYQVHNKGGAWLPKVKGYDVHDSDFGYAGNGHKIDAIKIDYIPTAKDKQAGKQYCAKYRVKAKGYDNFFSYQYDTQVSNTQDGYAGLIGATIDGFSGSIVEK